MQDKQSRPIALGRRFINWSGKDDPEEAEANSFLFVQDSSLAWEELLTRRRVVVLAEPGSGKTTELEEQARRVEERGDFAFLSTVQNVGEKGMETALRSREAALSAWRTSTRPAWFFLDSIDEAKNEQIRLADALREVAFGISGHEGRAHIVLSGRHTDWEFHRDLKDLERLLPLPPPDKALSPINPDELLVQYVRHEDPKEPIAPEAPVIVVMAPLTREQVKTFGRGRGVTNVQAFLEAIDKAALWRFARRPLDLQWLVEYWRANGTFGSFAQMLELSLRKRLQESDLYRARNDPLDQEQAYHALTRIGAALVLQKLKYVLVPDSSIDLSEGRTGLPLAGILPEWSPRNVAFLINRAVFDPVVAGMVRLHQDNEGEVRSYLAARWLKHLIDENCPRPAVHDLLFAATYGFELVLPSMRQTAAWLALWDSGIAQEILRRDPQLLLQAGDPASLPLDIRESLLRAVVAHPGKREHAYFTSPDYLQRFARTDMVPVIGELWNTQGSAASLRNFLLDLIWHGALADCRDLAEQIALNPRIDQHMQLRAGRALLATASKVGRQKYASWVLERGKSLAPAAVWDALEELFPGEINVTELLKVLDALDLAGVHSRLDRLAGKLASRLQDLPSLEQLLTGLLARLDPDEEAEDEPNDSLMTGIEEVSQRILMLLQPANISPAALEGVLRASVYRRYRKKPNEPLLQLISATPERRRAMFWHAAAAFATAGDLKGKPLTEWWQLRALGFLPPLERTDVDWLLSDASDRQDTHDRHLAADMAMSLWQRFELGDRPLDQLRLIGASRPEVLAVVTEWCTRRSSSPEERASQQQVARMEKRNSIKQAQMEKSWVDFAQKIRGSPQQLREIKPPTEKSVDARLYHLWYLLHGRNRNRYGFDSLDALVPVIGREALEPLRDAFVRFWRHWKPTLRSERPVGQLHTIANFDCMGLAGVSLEAATSPRWPLDLTESEAARAAGYATLELNGFPAWITRLAAQWPNPVRAVLIGELTAELEAQEPMGRGMDILQDLRQSDATLQRLLSPYLFDLLKRHKRLPLNVLDHILAILTTGMADSAELPQYLFGRIRRESDAEHLATYFEYAFQLAPARTYTTLARTISRRKKLAQTRLMQTILPSICGGPYGENAAALQRAPFDTLVNLIKLAYRTIRIEEDFDHASDGPGYRKARTDAEGARSALFRVLVETPGQATARTLLDFRAARDISIPAERLTTLAEQRAAEDSEFAPWAAEEVAAFEKDHLFAPRNPFDLQRLVQRRLTGMQHDLLHADFPQGKTLARQPTERDVQIWIADYLEKQGGRSYSVDRESHVADEKEPDLRFRAKASSATVPMEIKVAESWTLPQLEDALNEQLVKRYLRDQHNRWGILLLVHQNPHRWRHPKLGRWNIEQVVAHLHTLATRIASAQPVAPQPSVALLNVSTAFPMSVRRTPRSAKSRQHAQSESKRRKAGSRAKRNTGRRSRSARHQLPRSNPRKP